MLVSSSSLRLPVDRCVQAAPRPARETLIHSAMGDKRVRKGGDQLPPGADPELEEDLAQVPRNSPGADVDLGADLVGCESAGGEASDLRFREVRGLGHVYR